MTTVPASPVGPAAASATVVRRHSYRRTLVGLEAFVAVGAVAGTWQLMTGTYAPPVEDLEPLGLTSWVLPGVWLFSSVAVPSTTAAVAAWRRLRWAPEAVLVASGLLLVEILVQIPFVGPDPLQAVFGTLAVGLGVLGWRARRDGSWRR